MLNVIVKHFYMNLRSLDGYLSMLLLQLESVPHLVLTCPASPALHLNTFLTLQLQGDILNKVILSSCQVVSVFSWVWSSWLGNFFWVVRWSCSSFGLVLFGMVVIWLIIASLVDEGVSLFMWCLMNRLVVWLLQLSIWWWVICFGWVVGDLVLWCCVNVCNMLRAHGSNAHITYWLGNTAATWCLDAHAVLG